MKFNVYIVRDTIAEEWGLPFFLKNENVLKREMEKQKVQDGTEVWHIGYFTIDEGKLDLSADKVKVWDWKEAEIEVKY